MMRILLIESEKETAQLITDYLEINSFSVVWEENGTEGLDRAKEETINFVIQALSLPDINGFELCKEIRKMRDIPIMIISDRSDEIDLIRGLGVGADDYMVKPFSPNEMIARIKAHASCYKRLTSHKIEENEYIEYPGLAIDLTARRVFLHGEEIMFTTKEFDLLSFLASHPNKVFSKDALFSAVWGMDSLGDIATVTVHVKKIRQKIGQTSAQSGYIETVWGSGYRFRIIRSS